VIDALVLRRSRGTQVYLLLRSLSKSVLLVCGDCHFDCVVRVDLDMDEYGCGKRVQVDGVLLVQKRNDGEV
jgi:hypothetical protein